MTVGKLITVLAVVLFAVAAVGLTADGESYLGLMAWGLFVYALGRIVP